MNHYLNGTAVLSACPKQKATVLGSDAPAVPSASSIGLTALAGIGLLLLGCVAFGSTMSSR